MNPWPIFTSSWWTISKVAEICLAQITLIHERWKTLEFWQLYSLSYKLFFRVFIKNQGGDLTQEI